jgi:DNA polymerase (family 10)
MAVKEHYKLDTIHMENEKIAAILKLTASLMELHEENAFKIRAIQSAVYAIDKTNQTLFGMQAEALAQMDGFGKSIAAKILEICTTGALAELSLLLSNTPPGVVDLLGIKGVGPKKVRALWKELGLESREALLEACNMNKVAGIKGFGEKTQEAIRQELLFKAVNKERFLYAEAEQLAEALEDLIRQSALAQQVIVTGEVRRKMEIVDTIQLLAATNDPAQLFDFLDAHPLLEVFPKLSGPFVWRGKDKSLGAKIEVKICAAADFISQMYVLSAAPAHLKTKVDERRTLLQHAYASRASSEKELLEEIGFDFIEPEAREGLWEIEASRQRQMPELVTIHDLKGILHNHSTYSDGKHTLRQMAEKCKALGYEYLGICDHSKAGAFYNGGMYENKVKEQHLEIDQLNKELFPFKIFKGIESDILSDGSLDYDDAVLASFDFIVASIHSNLKMSEEKATARLITAIENPYTTMLGHPSGRILLEREAYPLNYKKVIDACAAHQVVIEINADPHRLDLDWRQVVYALEKGVMISINPDAHHMDSYANMKYGVYVGRKAGLTKQMTFNALSLQEVESYFQKKKSFSLK